MSQFTEIVRAELRRNHPTSAASAVQRLRVYLELASSVSCGESFVGTRDPGENAGRPVATFERSFRRLRVEGVLGA